MPELTTIVGDHAKARILEELAISERPLNPTEMVERAGLSSTRSWYDNKDDLLETVVEQQDRVGNSPLYGIDDSEKGDAIRTLTRNN